MSPARRADGGGGDRGRNAAGRPGPKPAAGRGGERRAPADTRGGGGGGGARGAAGRSSTSRSGTGRAAPGARADGPRPASPGRGTGRPAGGGGAPAAARSRRDGPDDSAGRGRGPGGGGRGASGGRGSGGRAPAVERREQAPARGVGGDQVEGRQAVRELLVAGRRRVREVLVAAEQEPAPILDDIRELCLARRVPLREVSWGRFDSLAMTQSAQGVLARAQSLPEADLDELVRRRKGRPLPLLVALDGVTDPGNFGALLRSAEGAGVTGIVLPRHRSVHVSPSVTKAAAGAVEYVPIALVGGMPTAISRLNELGVWTIGLDGSAPGSLYDLPLGDQPVCLVLGAEGKGLSRLVKERCSALASIPLGGQLNSLNVGAAGAVACFEVARLRRVHQAAVAAALDANAARVSAASDVEVETDPEPEFDLESDSEFDLDEESELELERD